MKKILRRLAPAVLLLTACAAAPDLAQAQISPASIGTSAFVSDTGRPVRLSDYRGKVVFLNVWGSWCTPCLQEMESIRALQASLGAAGNNVAFIFVSSRPADLQKDSAWLRQHGIVGESVSFQGGSPKGLYVPTTYLLDPSGSVAQYRSAPVDWRLHAGLMLSLIQRRAVL